MWATQVPQLDQLPDDLLSQYPELTGVTAQRAAFFTAIARHRFPQGLHNLYMPDALTLEAYHPYLSHDVPNRLAAIRGGDLDALEGLVDGGFDILHVPLLRSYGLNIFDVLDTTNTADLRDVFFDPAYGYFYDPRQNLLDLVPVSISYWAKRLVASSQEDFALQYLRASDSDLVSLLMAGIEEGAFIGNALFKMFDLTVTPMNALPELPITNEGKFNLFVNALRVAASQLGGFRLWFRGQTKEYPIHPVAGLASGPRSRRRPSLIPSVFRELQKRTDDLNLYRELVLRFGRWSYWASTQLPLSTESTPPNAPATGFAGTWESKRKYYDEQGNLINQESLFYPTGTTELRHGLVLQHYGAPTGYIDITSDPEVALWFALNRLVHGQYQPHTWSSNDPLDWPVVYVMALLDGIHPFIDSAALLQNTDMVRPQRQSCGLLGGSGNLFRNFPACFVTAVLRLEPGFTVSQPRTTSDIFPNPEQDPFLERLLAEDNRTAARHPAETLFPVTVYR